MASITIRKLEETTKRRLRARAGRHGRSMEEEAREILREALATDPLSGKSLVEAIRARFEPLGGVELPEIPREPMRDPPDFSEWPGAFLPAKA